MYFGLGKFNDSVGKLSLNKLRLFVEQILLQRSVNKEATSVSVVKLLWKLYLN